MQLEENTCLYHFPICPFCRIIRVMLEITGAMQNCYLKIEKIWEKRETFLNINPTGNVPLFVVQKIDEDCDKKTNAIWGYHAIIRYLNDKYPDKTLLTGNLEDRANILKYCEWFDKNFYEDVVFPLLNERVYVFYKKTRTANVEVIRIARRNGERYLGVFEKLIANRGNIVSDVFTFADITLACHLSSLDYLGEINWQTYPSLKDWYSVIKSKPVFRDLLYDSLQDIRSAKHYRELDF